ncbi:YhfH family protein [Priestia megaterium]|nr:YhfH family protein [Priestia megaterium]
MEPLDFYRRISRKTCETCGVFIKEQAESYVTVCQNCLHPTSFPKNK